MFFLAKNFHTEPGEHRRAAPHACEKDSPGNIINEGPINHLSPMSEAITAPGKHTVPATTKHTCNTSCFGCYSTEAIGDPIMCAAGIGPCAIMAEILSSGPTMVITAPACVNANPAAVPQSSGDHVCVAKSWCLAQRQHHHQHHSPISYKWPLLPPLVPECGCEVACTRQEHLTWCSS